MFRNVVSAGLAALLLMPGVAVAQQVEERPDGAPLLGALVGGLIGGAIGAAVSRKAPHATGFVPAAAGAHPTGGKPAGGKGAPAAVHRKPGK